MCIVSFKIDARKRSQNDFFSPSIDLSLKHKMHDLNIGLFPNENYVFLSI